MLGGNGKGLQGAIESLKSLVSEERKQVEEALTPPKVVGKSKWEDVDQTSMDSLRKHFEDIGDPRSDDELRDLYLQKPAATPKPKQHLRGWSDGDTSGRGGDWFSRRDRFAGTREQNQNKRHLSGWGGESGALTKGQDRKSVALGEIFTRMHGQGAGGKAKPPEERLVDLQQENNRLLKTIAGKKGGMAP
jgi:hypothetical protein